MQAPYRIVIKLGTSVLTAGSARLNRPYMVGLARQVAALREQGFQVALVSSGAVAAGRERMSEAPTQRNRANVPLRQMFAAVGQSRLMHLYEQLFDLYGLQVAQALLTRDDLRERRRYLNARNTLNLCLERGIVPIINENDAVVTAEIRVGDNDNLSALVASLIEAQLLVILTDMPGLYDADPRSNPQAQLIRTVPVIDEHIWTIAGGAGSAQGTGGMRTKIEAADLATRAGATVVIAAGKEPDVILRLVAGEAIGTRFPAAASPLDARKRWILAETARQSRVVVDPGAVAALLHHGSSLLPAGISVVEGEFDRGQTIRIYAPDGHEIARGLTQYRSADVRSIRGLRSAQIAETLGYDYGPELVHRDDMVIL
ncbi:glutamate 5-kinase [Candidatus Viridilinea mediisalina]|uniref:Glutamate 5-kinase n=1 Tax=Candidatus Viridilinea mediisalina TaxID=2024553 RepID=A0A2A6RNX1_9CHLR|nr:glutamate 5-kinase [Candidatus Viridilinea mediisalina]PDW04591.1 glutamate 5-kinase [Candidatus Viridilinea mediisalina]